MPHGVGRFESSWIRRLTAAVRERRIVTVRDWPAVFHDLWDEAVWASFVPSNGRFDRTALNESYRRWCNRRRHEHADRIPIDTIQSASIRVTVGTLVGCAGRVAQLAESIKRQTNSRFELHLVLSSNDQTLKAAAAAVSKHDDRIRTLSADATVGDLAPTSGFLVVLPQDGLLAAEALAQIERAIVEEPSADWLYTDEDRIEGDVGRQAPQLKGQFSPDLAICDGYATQLAAIRQTLLAPSRRLLDLLTPIGLRELLLQLTDDGGLRIKHVPAVCLHQCTDRGGDESDARARRIVDDTLKRRGLPGRVVVRESTKPAASILRVQWLAEVSAALRVTIVIPTRDRLDLLLPCIESLVATVDARYTTLLVVDDASANPLNSTRLQQRQSEARLPCRVMRVERDGSAFNYAALMNKAAAEVDTPLMLHLNDDVEAIEVGWLEQMVGWFSMPQVGVVGARLIRPDGTLQHAGVILNARRGLPLHLFEGLDSSDPGYMERSQKAQNVSAVTGACLLTRTSLYQTLRGFDALNFAIQYNDIDYCLRASETGFRIVYEPSATLVHRTGASRQGTYSTHENRRFREKYGRLSDGYWSPHLAPRSLATPTPLLRNAGEKALR
jgi:GT2 family glycosyltransferase